MKIIAAIFTILALFPAVSSASQDADAMKANTPSADAVRTSGSRVYAVSGEVYISRGKNPAHRVVTSEPISSDTLIQTDNNSTALLKFADGQVATMQSNSIFKVREYRYDPKQLSNSSAVFSLFQGGMRFITGLIGKLNHQAFRLSTPNATIGIRGTDFMVAMAGNSMYSQVLKGKIAMTNAGGVKVVGAGQSVAVPSSRKLASLVAKSAIPAGTFGELLAIPVEPSAIPAPAPSPAPEPVPAPAVPVTPAVAAVPVATAPVPAIPAAAASAGIAAGAVAGMAASESEPAQAAPPVEAKPAASPEKLPEPEATDQMRSYRRSDVSLTGKIGTLGLGAELDIELTQSLGARLGLNSFNNKYNATSGTVNYDFNFKLQTISALADWYPFDNSSFRTSVGAMYNNNKVSLTGQPTGGTYTINGHLYSSTEVGSLQGEMSFNKVAPYIGIGWGKPAPNNQGWGMTTDFGVLYQGTPKTSLVATCGTIAGTPSCTTLQNDAAAENTKLQNDLSNFKWWPVASVGISYQW
ncbi:MAG: FecR family protein [Gallionella sp.]